MPSFGKNVPGFGGSGAEGHQSLTQRRHEMVDEDAWNVRKRTGMRIAGRAAAGAARGVKGTDSTR
jgi:hypothetical protein